MNMNQSAHMKEDLYKEIARLRRKKNKIIKALMAALTLCGAVIVALVYWAQTSIVTG